MCKCQSIKFAPKIICAQQRLHINVGTFKWYATKANKHNQGIKLNGNEQN